MERATHTTSSAGSPPRGREDESALTVYFDGACPLCRREVAVYRDRTNGVAVEWVDLSAGCGEAVAPDLSRGDALARFHVRLPDGRLVSGAAGFGALWAATPGFRWLGALASHPLSQPVLELAYRGFLKVRPAIQRLAGAVERPEPSGYPRWLERELRSDHAGETGAVAIYRGILAVSRDRDVRAFAGRHLEAESRHLDLMDSLLAPRRRSKLQPLWTAAGFVTGALPALAGPQAVFATIEAVEAFVDGHYGAQIERLAGDARRVSLRETLLRCRADELDHRDDARRLIVTSTPSVMLRGWLRAVAVGSSAGVWLARRI